MEMLTAWVGTISDQKDYTKHGGDIWYECQRRRLKLHIDPSSGSSEESIALSPVFKHGALSEIDWHACDRVRSEGGW